MPQKSWLALASSLALVLSGCATTAKGPGSSTACQIIGAIAGGAGGYAGGSTDDKSERGVAIGMIGVALGGYIGHHLCYVNQEPTPRISAEPTAGEAPLEVAFRGAANDPDSQIVGYQWDFGDGAGSSEQHPTHTYSAAGTYTARLTVADDDEGVGTTEVEISVSEPPPPPPAPRRIVLRGVQFSFDSSAISDESEGILAVAVHALMENPDVQIEIAGHTDHTGPEAYNQRLSERRAQSVLGHLVAAGVDAGRLTAEGFGESQPIADNGTRDGGAQNRRVEIRQR